MVKATANSAKASGTAKTKIKSNSATASGQGTIKTKTNTKVSQTKPKLPLPPPPLPPSPPPTTACEECEGTGVTKCYCERCDGTGETWYPRGINGYAVACDECYGEPEEEECESCGGSGVFTKKQKQKKDNRTYYDCTKCKDTGKYFEDFRGCNGFEVDCDEC